ncbi:MAG: hypothetical protein ACKN9T_11975 [Candidatus Methylumidiphilus sp.]
MNVEELKHEISQLPSEDMQRFTEWFEEFKADQWDKQIAEDILAGRFEALENHIDEAFLAGHAAPL